MRFSASGRRTAEDAHLAVDTTEGRAVSRPGECFRTDMKFASEEETRPTPAAGCERATGDGFAEDLERKKTSRRRQAVQGTRMPRVHVRVCDLAASGRRKAVKRRDSALRSLHDKESPLTAFMPKERDTEIPLPAGRSSENTSWPGDAFDIAEYF